MGELARVAQQGDGDTEAVRVALDGRGDARAQRMFDEFEHHHQVHRVDAFGLGGAYSLYMLCAAVSILFVVKLVRETKGKPLEEM